MPRSPRAHQLAVVSSLRPVTERLWLLRPPATDPDPATLTETAHRLGAILALALGEHRTVMTLSGLEPVRAVYGGSSKSNSELSMTPY